MATHALWNLLQQLKSDYEWVELSHRLNNDSPYWSGMPEGSVEIGKPSSIGAIPCWNV